MVQNPEAAQGNHAQIPGGQNQSLGAEYKGERRDQSPERRGFLGYRWPVSLPALTQEGSSAAPPAPGLEGTAQRPFRRRQS